MDRPGRRNKAIGTSPQKDASSPLKTPSGSPHSSPTAATFLNTLGSSKESGGGGRFRSLVMIGVLFAVFELALRGPAIFGVGGGAAAAGAAAAAGTRGAAEGAAAVARKLPEHTGKCLSLQAGPNPVDPENRHHPDAANEPEKCQFYTEPTPYVELLMKALVGFPSHGTCKGDCTTVGPFQPIARKYGLDWPPMGYTMVGTARLENFRAAIEEVNRKKIPGDVMELGVWRGGAMIMATAVSKEYKSMGGTMDRRMYVLDAFEDIPASSYGVSRAFLFNTEAAVIDHFKTYNAYDSNVHFVRGLFKNTVPKMATDDSIQQIAVLRVDGNFYDSYQDSLYYMYGKVPVGGIVIFDDVMSHKAVMRCWLDFKADHGLPEELNRIDVHSAWFRKTKDVTIDMSKMRPPQDVNKQ